MNLRFYIDPTTEWPHIHNHQVDEDEVADVLEHPGEDRPGREGSRVALGQASAGRYLRVVYVPDAERDSIFVVTAYELNGKPLEAYRRRRKKEATMKQAKLPEGWNEDRIKAVLTHYSSQSEDEATAEDRAAVEPAETVMRVPEDLVPVVRELIAKRQIR